MVRTPTAGEMVRGRLPSAQRKDVEIRIGDVTRPDTLAPALAGVDGVVHLVAIPRDYNHGADLRLVNTEGTRAVVVAMREAGATIATKFSEQPQIKVWLGGIGHAAPTFGPQAAAGGAPSPESTTAPLE